MSEEQPARELTSQILSAGDGAGAFDKLAPIVYSELKGMARGMMARESAQTLQPTALVHEAYLRLYDETAIGNRGRHYFYGAAARAMRQVLIERAVSDPKPLYYRADFLQEHLQH